MPLMSNFPVKPIRDMMSKYHGHDTWSTITNHKPQIILAKPYIESKITMGWQLAIWAYIALRARHLQNY